MIEALLALALALPGAKFPGILVQGGFLTPSGNIACNVGKLGSGLGIGCSVYSKRSASGALSTWWMKTSGTVSFAYVVADPASDYAKLAYGKTYSWHGIRCSSATTGLTCRNASGRGFFLSRARQRTF